MIHNFQRVLPDTSAAAGKLCILGLGVLGLVFIRSCFVSCLFIVFFFYVSLRNLCSGTCRKIRSPLFLFALNSSPTFTSKRQRWYSLWRCTLYSVKPLPRRLAKTLWYGKAMVGKWVIRVHVQRGIFFALTGSELFYQFLPQGFPKLADDRTGSVRDVCFEVLFQSMPIDERVLCGYRLIIDWPIPIDTN